MRLRRIAIWMSVASFSMLPHAATAVGFGLEQQSASNAGYAFAGSATAEDASAMFWNPASLSLIPGRQGVVGINAIYGRARFTDQGTVSPAGPAFPPTGGSGSNPVGLNWLPNAYFVTDLTSSIKGGIGINSPFGLRTEYDRDWIGRYHAVDSVLKTVNINPAVAWKVNPSMSIGAGVNFQYFDVRTSTAIDFGTACFASPFGPAACAGAGILPQSRDGLIEIKGDSWGVGWNIGASVDLTPQARVGIAYRSSIKHEVKGEATFTNPTLPAPFSALTASATDTGARSTIKTPDSLSTGLALRLERDLTLVADVSWTGWQKFRELRVRFDNGASDAVTPENWRNTFRFAVGVGYLVNQQLKIRAGVAYEQSAIPDEFRTPRVPDNDHTILAAGLNYKLSPSSSVDVAYHHGFVKRAPVNTTAAGAGALVGNYEVSADVVSVQYNHGF
jgi:long-chain fatty acid transport protein